MADNQVVAVVAVHLLWAFLLAQAVAVVLVALVANGPLAQVHIMQVVVAVELIKALVALLVLVAVEPEILTVTLAEGLLVL